MSDAVLLPVDAPRRFHFSWVPAVLFRPRQTFSKIAAQSSGVWLTPLLILTVTAVLQVLVAGSIKQSAALSGQVELPPEFQYYSPEQQAQFQQALAATSGPVFIYVFPALMATAKVWVGWLLVGGLIHLVLTLLGGRGDTDSAMNLVAWSSLPLAVRELVRCVAMFSSKHLIANPGLAGFAPAGTGDLSLYLSAFLSLIDLYIIWHIVLMIIGVRAGNGLTLAKATGGILVSILLVLLLQALLMYFMTRLGGLNIIRPFF